MIITPFEDLVREAEEIYEFTQYEVSDNPEEVKERGNALVVLIARTGKMLSDAKYYLRERSKNDTMKIIEKILTDGKISASVQKAWISSICREEQYLVDEIERLNTALTHTLDWYRSLYSRYKKEEEQANYFNK